MAYKAEIISDDIWPEMLKICNQPAHDYDGVIVKEYCQKIIGEYTDYLYAFKEAYRDLAGWVIKDRVLIRSGRGIHLYLNGYPHLTLLAALIFAKIRFSLSIYLPVDSVIIPAA